MPRYRFPGRITTVPAFCKPKECKPFTIIKVCPPQPYIKDYACRPNIYDRAIIRVLSSTTTTCAPTTTKASSCGCGRKQCQDERRYERCPEAKCEEYVSGKPRFVLETFSNSLILCPINLDRFCGYDFKDGEIVAVEAEDMSNVSHQENTCCIPGAIPVKLFNIKRTWKLQIHQLRGIVQASIDSNGQRYHMVTEVTDLTSGDPSFSKTQNSLLFSPIVIHYEIVNIMGQTDAETTMVSLEGKIINATYVDYGAETKERIGLPIVITDYVVVG